MDYTEYVNKYVKVELHRDIYFKGLCIDGGDGFLILIDINNQRVTLKEESITYVQEWIR